MVLSQVLSNPRNLTFHISAISELLILGNRLIMIELKVLYGANQK
jgi:hypothetical protein